MSVCCQVLMLYFVTRLKGNLPAAKIQRYPTRLSASNDVLNPPKSPDVGVDFHYIDHRFSPRFFGNRMSRTAVSRKRRERGGAQISNATQPIKSSRNTSLMLASPVRLRSLRGFEAGQVPSAGAALIAPAHSLDYV